MDGPARAQAALARIEEQCEAVSQAMFRVNLPLRNMAKNLTDEEVTRLKVNKKDGPAVYVRLWEENRAVEKTAKWDVGVLTAKREVSSITVPPRLFTNSFDQNIEIDLEEDIYNDAHFAPYQLRTDISQGPLPLDTKDSALRGIYHRTVAAKKKVRLIHGD